MNIYCQKIIASLPGFRAITHITRIERGVVMRRMGSAYCRRYEYRFMLRWVSLHYQHLSLGSYHIQGLRHARFRRESARQAARAAPAIAGSIAAIGNTSLRHQGDGVYRLDRLLSPV